MAEEPLNTVNPWESVSEAGLMAAIEKLEYPVGAVENGAEIVRDELKTMAMTIFNLRNEPPEKRAITYEGAARSGKTNICLMLQEVFNKLGVITSFVDCHPYPSFESQQEQIDLRRKYEEPKVIFLDEVMSLDPETIKYIRKTDPETILIMTMGYDVRRVDVFSIQATWDKILLESGTEATKLIANSLWSTGQVGKWIEQYRKFITNQKQSPNFAEYISQWGEDEWSEFERVCHLVSFGHPWMLVGVADILSIGGLSDIFDAAGVKELRRAGNYLLAEVRNEVVLLSKEKTDDGKMLLTTLREPTKFYDSEIEDVLASDASSLTRRLCSIVSPQSFQHLYSQLLLKMTDLAQIAMGLE